MPDTEWAKHDLPARDYEADRAFSFILEHS